MLRSHIGWPSPEVHRHGRRPRQPARRRRGAGHQGDPRPSARRDVLGARRRARALPGRRPPGPRGAARRWEKRLAAWDGDREATRPALAGRACPGWEAKLPTLGGRREGRHPQGQRGLPQGARRRGRPGSWAAAPTSPATPAPMLKDHGVFSPDEPAGRQIYFGVREHGMGGVMNGMAAHGGVLPVGGTFFVFSDYMRPRCAWPPCPSTRSIFSCTHDSVGLGEDGPTHQPIEHLAALRAMPQLRLDPPGRRQRDRRGLARRGRRPTGRPPWCSPARTCPCSRARRRRRRGPGRLRAGRRRRSPDVVLIGTGSEVAVCVEAAGLLADEGLAARVVSMPSWELFAAQDDGYQDVGAAARAAHAGRRGRRQPSAGTAGPTTASASTASAPRRRATSLWPTSGSPPTTWPTGPASWSHDLQEDDAMTKLHDLLLRSRARAPGSTTSSAAGSPAASSTRWVERGVRGITSNPTIFQKAIAGSATSTTTSSASWSAAAPRSTTPTGRWSPTTSTTRCASCARCTTRATASTASCRSRSRPTSPATPTAPSRRPATCTTASTSPTCT